MLIFFAFFKYCTNNQPNKMFFNFGKHSLSNTWTNQTPLPKFDHNFYVSLIKQNKINWSEVLHKRIIPLLLCFIIISECVYRYIRNYNKLAELAWLNIDAELYKLFFCHRVFTFSFVNSFFKIKVVLVAGIHEECEIVKVSQTHYLLP